LIHGFLCLHIIIEGQNQPFDYPRSKARGLLRVDTERRFILRPEGRGLVPSKYQENPPHPLPLGGEGGG
jgi:hypothetical protein